METLIGRYELRSITSDGQFVVGIYEDLDSALEAKQLKMRSQSYPVVIYDAQEEMPVLPGAKNK